MHLDCAGGNPRSHCIPREFCGSLGWRQRSSNGDEDDARRVSPTDLICGLYALPSLEFQLARRPSTERMNASATPTQVDKLPRADVPGYPATYGSNKYGSCYSGQRASSLHRSPSSPIPFTCHPAYPCFVPAACLLACLPDLPSPASLSHDIRGYLHPSRRVPPSSRDSLLTVAIHLAAVSLFLEMRFVRYSGRSVKSSSQLTAHRNHCDYRN